MNRRKSRMSMAMAMALLVEFILFTLFSASEMFFSFPRRDIMDALVACLFLLLIFSVAMLWFASLRDLNRSAWILLLIFSAAVSFLTLTQVVAFGPSHTPFFTFFFAWHASLFGLMFTKPIIPLWRLPKPKIEEKIHHPPAN